MTHSRKFPLKPGRAYVVRERMPDLVFRAFREAVQRGQAGFLVSRTNPIILREDRELEATQIFWLTEADGEDRVSPTNLDELYDEIRSFLASRGKAVFAMEGVEYLASRIGSVGAARSIQDMRDLVTGAGGTFVVSVDEATADENLVPLLEREFEPLPVPSPEDHGITDVFVIDAVGGILTCHAARQSAVEIDADVMAGMLTVIMNFVRTSFAEGSDQLRRLELGDRTVLLERSDRLIVAVVLTGHEPSNLRPELRAFADRAERLYGGILDRWSGDISEMDDLGAMAEDVFFEPHGGRF